MRTTEGSTKDRAGFWSVAAGYATTELLVLWRMRTPLVFMFAVPATLALTLGSAVAGEGSHGRAMLGIAVMFSFTTTHYTGLALFREFGSNTWVRQALHRPPRGAFLLGKILPIAGIGLTQLSLFTAIAVVFYGTPVHGSVWQLLAIAVTLLSVSCAMGVVLYLVTADTSTFESLFYIFLITAGSVGGAIVPDGNLPALSRAVGVLTPHHWALRALDEATSGRGEWGPVLQSIGVLGCCAVVLGAVAATAFDYRRQKYDLY
ncbi:ABC transporter permease [Streptosporangium sp. NPDC049376]|uniref:ABC transporter permease n=1 Tax=Streptosporangium sp. NPDC049376 TaxID=3366192 RepID=UPI003789D42D